MTQPETISSAQAEFVKEHKKHHRFVRYARILVLLVFLFIWELASQKKWIDSFFFSSPSLVAESFVSMISDRSLFLHIGVTLMETITSFLLIVFFSLVSASLLWHFKKLSEILEPYLVVLNSLPKSALAPLLIVWLGTGIKTIVVAGISVALFGAVIHLYTGFLQVDPEKQMLLATLGGNRRDTFFKVILPASVPVILSNMKVNIGLALVGVIIGEFLAARRGLGYLIIYGSQVFQLHLVITSILILCAIAMLLYQCIQWMEHWYKKKV